MPLCSWYPAIQISINPACVPRVFPRGACPRKDLPGTQPKWFSALKFQAKGTGKYKTSRLFAMSDPATGSLRQ